MAKFIVTHLQAVWERAAFVVEAIDEADAREKVYTGAIVDTLWTQREDAVESIDDQIVSVTPFKDPEQ